MAPLGNWKDPNQGMKLFVLYACYVVLASRGCTSSESAQALFDYLLLNYDTRIRPVEKTNGTLIVNLGLSISQLIDIDETNQVMISSVWLKQSWNDYRLRWNPKHFDGIEMLNIPVGSLWKPDITLYNTADGEYDVLVANSAVVLYDGTVKWSPPAVYNSVCRIESKDFPFDEQKCIMKFGSWTYNADFLDLEPMYHQVDQADYWENGEWEIVETPVTRNVIRYICCDDRYVDITFTFVLHRNPLFYIITLVVPCLLISFSTLLVFYLPTDAQERITLSISILIAVTVFLLLIPALLPPTSDHVPLVGRYILFTFFMSTFSILGTILVIHVHYRTADTHVMPNWMRTVFIIYLPRIMRLERPSSKKDYENHLRERRRHQLRKGYSPSSQIWTNYSNGKIYHTKKLSKQAARFVIEAVSPSLLEEIEGRERGDDETSSYCSSGGMDPSALTHAQLRVIDCIHFIVSSLKEEDQQEQVSDDWKFVALVMDRLLLAIFFFVNVVMTAVTFYGPSVFWEDETSHVTPIIERPVVLDAVDYRGMFS
ncbi:neuronal acetylcholine receptor subunit alpha-3-like [Ptychodera flava]|uniref:neuronal acetylcholine receptor subunit alpha-3-like n=1 Tax=Ptychodera flava TaxID=63121 RepID=UPI00396A0120